MTQHEFIKVIGVLAAGIGTTMDIYAHFMPQMTRAGADKLGKFFAQVRA